ncbi:MAG: HEAT repeat domain-containing protein, partial [Acidobacteriota bacterium]
VLNYALASAALHLREEHIPLIVRHLGNPMTQQVAQDALAAYGARIEEPLRRLLRDPRQRSAIRRAVPDVLARLGSQKAADILTAELAHDDGEEMDRDIVAALYRIRADRPGVRFREKHIHAAVRTHLRKAAAAVLAQAGASGKRSGDGGRHPEARLGMKIKLVFDLLTLVYPAEDIVKAYQNIEQGTRKSVDYSLELLDNLLAHDLKALLFPLVEDLPPQERARRLSKALRGGSPARPWRRLKSRGSVV